MRSPDRWSVSPWHPGTRERRRPGRSSRVAGRPTRPAASAPADSQVGGDLGHDRADLARVLGDEATRAFQGLDLRRRRPLAAGDDRPRVAHLLARWGSEAGDVRHDRLLHLLLHELGCFLLGRAADLADHDHRAGFGIGLEGREGVDEARPRHGVTTDPHAGGLPDPPLRHLVQRLVGQRARPAHDPDRAAAHGDLAGGDADVALAGRDDPRAVGAEQSGAGVIMLEAIEEVRLVVGGNAFGDHDDDLGAGFGRLEDRVRDARRRNEHARRVGSRLRHRLLHGREHGDPVDVRPRLLRVRAGDDVRAVVPVAQPVETALGPRQALVHDPRGLVDEDAHEAPASSTALRAASIMVGCDTRRSDSCSARIARPSSAFVPSRRMTIGDRISTRPSACTIPFATSSPLVIPPKMLMKMDFTSPSLLMTSSAFAITSALAPPPMSRKFAGSPSTWLTMSTVLMASPAPLAMMPTYPSSPTYWRPLAWAAASRSSRSWVASYSDHSCRKAALSSRVTLASRACTRPSVVTISGLISTRSAASLRPSTGSTCKRAIASGASAATCSMSTPPRADSIPRSSLADRSSVNDA